MIKKPRLALRCPPPRNTLRTVTMSNTSEERLPFVAPGAREGASSPDRSPAPEYRVRGGQPLPIAIFTRWLRRLVLLALAFTLLAWVAMIWRRPRPVRESPMPRPLPPAAEVSVPAHLPPAPAGAELMLLQPWGPKVFPLLRSGPWAGSGVSPTRRAIVIQHGIGRDMDNAWSDVRSALALEGRVGDTLVLAPNFYLGSDRGRWFDPDLMYSWSGFDAWVGGADAEGTNDTSTYDLYDYLRHLLLDRARYPDLREIVFAGHSGGGAAMTRYGMVAQDWTSRYAAVRYVVANAPSFLYFTHDRPRPVCEGFNEYMYGMDWPVRYVDEKLAQLQGRQDARALARRFFARPLVMLQGDLDTYARYPVGRYGCGVLAQGGKDRRERSYAYWVYKVLLSGISVAHPRVGGEARWRELRFHGRAKLEESVEPWGRQGGDTWVFNHDFCHVLRTGHVGGDMWKSACGRAALLGRDIDESVW